MKLKRKSQLFIIGAQRSGTTLLRLILNSHSLIAIPEEAEFLRPLLKRQNLYRSFTGKEFEHLCSYLEKNEQLKLWNYDITPFLHEIREEKSIALKELIDALFSSYARNESKMIWGDKTPVFLRYIDMFYTLYPQGLFIHIVRDGRDVFDSWRKMDPEKDNAAVTALDWWYKLFRIERSFRRIPDNNKLEIRYEDLIENPGEIVQKICEKMGVPFEDEMLNFYRKSNQYIGDHHSKLIFKPLTRTNKKKWKRNLTQKEIRIYTFLARRYLVKYGYDVDVGRPGGKCLVSILQLLLKGLPLKLSKVVQAKLVTQKALRHGESTQLAAIGSMPSGKAKKPN